MEAGDHHDVLRDEYKLGVDYLTNHLTRLWTRFNFFLTLETALVVALLGLFRNEQLSRAVLVIPGVALLISLTWLVTGVQDRFLVVVYRTQIGHIVRRLVPDQGDRWPYIGQDIDELEDRIGKVKRTPLQRRWKPLSITRMPAWFPLLTVVLWLLAFILIASEVG
jgi:hypothetical protein